MQPCTRAERELKSGNLLARYSQGAGIDEPLSELRSGAISYYEQDGLGSVTSLSSIGGALANTYAYDSFGNTSSSTGTVTNPYQYTGRDYDPGTGLRYYRARYYDATVGRFLNEDPLGFVAGDNFYPYVDNSPVNFTDTFGLQALPKPVPGPQPVPNPGPPSAPPTTEPDNPKGPIAFCLANPEICLAILYLISPGQQTVNGLPARCYDEIDPVNCPNQRPKPDQACKKSKPTEEQCEEMYAVDTAFCSTLRNPRDRAACRAQASERYANCLAGRQIPPLPWRRPN